VRGRWGELTLRRTVELAGLSAHCDFTEQVSVQSDEGEVKKPDLIVHLPERREIVVDAKVPLLAYLAAIEAEGEEAREKALSDHARQFRKHMGDLGGKAYWQQFPQSPEFVVMFVPGESILAAAADVDRSLIEDGMSQQVVVATPTTLVALLRAVAYGWRQERIAQDAQEVASWGRQLYERMAKLADYLSDIGKGLEKARDSYNEAVGSLERMVLPAARRFKDLGAGSDREVSPVKPVEVTLRAIDARSLPEGGQ
jgi:DNA recombination protein RmuC